jgi:uncharacterized membrane protein (DUF2068 family)
MKRVAHKRGLRLIAGFKTAKGLLLLGASAGLLALLNRDLSAVLERGVDALHAGSSHNRTVHGLIAALGVVDVKTLEELGFGTLAYGSLTLTEGVGLWLAMRWAAYLTIVANSLFIPLEIYTLSQRFTLLKSVVLAINAAIVWYLVRHLRAEQGHGGAPHARAAVVE